MKNCVCIVCRVPNQIWLDFLNDIPGDVFIVINDHIDLNTFKPGKVRIVEIDTNECFRNGFNHANRVAQSESDIRLGFVHLPFPEVTAWDKALYYFCNLNHDYDNIWFCEEDCLIYARNLFERMNSQHENTDLLVKENNLNFEKPRWCWNHVRPFLSEPNGFSFVQACRLSRKLLSLVNYTARRLNRLVIIETLFNTLAMQNNLSMRHPPELSLLHWDRNLNSVDRLDPNFIYHPVKDINLHAILRWRMDKNLPQFITNHEIMNLDQIDVWHIINNPFVRQNFNDVLYEFYYREDLRNRGVIQELLLHHFLFHGIREDYVSNFNFDHDRYRENNKNLDYLVNSDLYHHQVYNGKAENRIHYIKNTFEIQLY